VTGRALIIGITGQDGSYLAELLLSKGYTVAGTMRRSSLPNLQRLEPILDRLHLFYADLSDGSGVAKAVYETMPDEVYNLGAMPDVRISFDQPEYTGDITGLGAVRVLEAVHQIKSDTRYYQAGSSEMFGMNPDVPTNERSTFRPGSPYAAAKCYAHHMTVNYREAYGMHASNGILFNHESERRGTGFVTRKITRGIARLSRGEIKNLVLGNIDASRDWGHARDYVRAMWLMLQQPEPDDYVIATGETHTVREFLDEAFGVVGRNDWDDYVELDKRLFRPVDPPVLLGDATKARTVLDWKPEIGFSELVRRMVEHDVVEAGRR
jgi:GDPmannose 4,6-dehydratase